MVLHGGVRGNASAASTTPTNNGMVVDFDTCNAIIEHSSDCEDAATAKRLVETVHVKNMVVRYQNIPPQLFFRQYENIKKIVLDGTHCTNVLLCDGMFEGCKRLKTLKLQNVLCSRGGSGATKTFPPGLLKGCASLKHFDCSNNDMDETFFERPFFFDFCRRTLRTFVARKMSGNGVGGFTKKCIERIDGAIFEGCAALETVDFSNNRTVRDLDRKLLWSCTSLKTFRCSSTDLQRMEKDFFNACRDTLKYLDFDHNSGLYASDRIDKRGLQYSKMLNKFTRLKRLNIVGTFRNINLLPILTNNRDTLRHLMLDGRQRDIPVEIVDCAGLSLIQYDPSPYWSPEHGVYTVPVQAQRFIESVTRVALDVPPNFVAMLQQQMLGQRNVRRAMIHQRSVYENKQNVHDDAIVESFKKSIAQLTTQKTFLEKKHEYRLDSIDDVINKYVRSEEAFSADTKDALESYLTDDYVHSAFLLTFFELFAAVMFVILHDYKDQPETQRELKKILNDEIEKSRGLCFTGRMSRLANTLNGFTSLIKVEIRSSDQISNIYNITKNQCGGSHKKHRELFEKEMRERGYPQKTIDEWVGNFEPEDYPDHEKEKE